MRRIVLFGLLALVAVGAAHHACAQRHGGGAPGFARAGYGFGRAPVAPPSRFRHPYLPFAAGYAYLPYVGDDSYLAYDFGDAYPYAPPPLLSMQPPPQPSAPGVEGHAVINEYKWPAAGAASSAPSSAISAPQPQAFAIVLKDGSTLSASMVFASGGSLHYVDLDDNHLRVSISEVDRAATLKLNRARNLNLHLPAAQ